MIKLLTEPMAVVLGMIQRGEDPYSGCSSRADHGGRKGTLAALIRRGFMTWEHHLTESGLIALDKHAAEKAAAAPASGEAK